MPSSNNNLIFDFVLALFAFSPTSILVVDLQQHVRHYLAMSLTCQSLYLPFTITFYLGSFLLYFFIQGYSFLKNTAI